MENESLNLKNISFNKKLKKNNFNQLLLLVFIILFLIIFSLILRIFKMNSLIYKYIPILKNIKNYGDNYLKNKEKINDINRNKRNYILKSIYDKDIGFYKQILKLYIENKTKFRIRGRQKIMEISGKIYNESNIKTIQDKLNWLLIHENPENKTNLVDKILLHEYSKKKLGKDICVPILKVYNSSEEIDLNQLPEKFVLKCNHGCGMNILCSDKSKLNLMNAKIKLDEWMNLNYGLRNFEYQYININKKIFAEQYLLDNIK